ncbi:type VII secretion target [Kibdelosporangium persicum]|uniref:Excreted virulence factor EspC, type VII ESX diderm n=1 Tax=Kibdelosporangium persicum TaxID=2698649 RepID=A0ABX2FG60_9PSEU|nr:type VII secretion target [Kibdelosporangium persicum]NRN70360.1 Excreted virulence factor EspC, type VII ESX diderm [Kibdelosporangium persicum]
MSFEVVVDDLRGHASHLNGLMDRLGTAIDAANTVSMSDEAYGLLCSFLPLIINPMEQEGLKSLRAASEAVGTTAGNVRLAADRYEQVDQAISRPFAETLTESSTPAAVRSLSVRRADNAVAQSSDGDR